MTENHDLSNIFGNGSPVDKLYDLDGHILLIGVGYDKNTSLHLAETRANFPSKRYADKSSAMLIDGVRQWVTYNTQIVDDTDFIALGTQYDQENDIQIHQVGNAKIRFIKVRPLVDWAVQWMEQHRV